MRLPLLLGSFIACAFVVGSAGPGAAGCDPVGSVQFVCGPVGPEDLVPVPGSDWIIASGRNIYLVNTRDKSTTVLFPTEPPQQRQDTKTYSACPGLANPPEKGTFTAHGLNLRPGKNGQHTLYVVHHGDRESIEVFELDARGRTPTLTWIGCAIAPESVGENSVAVLPDGGFAVTNFQARGDPNGRAKLLAGENTGNVWEWHPGAGWQVVPGSDMPGPNGIEASKDGKWLYIAGWANKTFVRLSRGQTPVKKNVIQTPFHVDNLRWQADGSLLAAGQGGSTEAVLRDCLGPEKKCSEVSTNVAKIHPDTLKFQQIIHWPSNEVFRAGTSALQVGKEIWVGGVGGAERIARFPAP